MYDHSFLELEEIMGDEKWSFEVLESKFLACKGSNDDGSQNANNNSSSGGIDPTSIKYDELLGWAWFTDTNWVYSYTNLSWYYMHPTTDGFYVWNANLPDNGWMKLERG